MVEFTHAVHETATLCGGRGRIRGRPPGTGATRAGLAEHLREATVRLQVAPDHDRVVRLERLGHPVHERPREAQRGTHLPDRRARPIRDQIGDHARVLGAVRLVDVLDDLLPAGRREIDIDVRVGDAALVDEPLEQQVVPDGIDPGDAQRVRHDRIPGTPPPLGRDAALPCEPHQVVADEEEAGEMRPADDTQLMGEPPAHLCAHPRVIHGIALPDTRPAQFGELLIHGPAVGDGDGREVAALLAEWRVTARGKLWSYVQTRAPGTLRDGIRRLVTGGTHLQLRPRQQVVFPVVTPQAGALLHGPPVADGHQHILELTVLGQGVVGVARDQGRQPQIGSQVGDLVDQQVIVRTQVMLELREHAAAQPGHVRDVLRVPAQRGTGTLSVTRQEPPRDLAVTAAGKQRQTLGVTRQQLVGEPGHALRAVQMRRADHPAQALPAGHVAT